MQKYPFTRMVRSQIDFFLRNRAHILLPQIENTVLSTDERLRCELFQFLSRFSWEALQSKIPQNPIVVDIGATNFFMAPLLHNFFSRMGFQPEIHGVENEARKRYLDLRTRADYGFFYANSIPRGNFHPTHFSDFRTEMDVAFILNPFTEYAHLHNLLRPQSLVVVSHATEKEFEIGLSLAKRSALRLLQTKQWHPVLDSIQKKPRLGAIFTR